MEGTATLTEVMNRLNSLESLLMVRQTPWVSKLMLQRLTGWSPKTINNMVSRGLINKKKGKDSYSYRSYFECGETHQRRPRKKVQVAVNQ